MKNPILILPTISYQFNACLKSQVQILHLLPLSLAESSEKTKLQSKDQHKALQQPLGIWR